MPKARANAPPATKAPIERPQSLGIEAGAEWNRAAKVAVGALARGGRPFTSLDVVRLVGPPPSPSLLPSLIRAAHLSKLIEKSDVPLGTVWVGVNPDEKGKRSRTAGRRATDRPGLSGELWEKMRDRAVKEKVTTAELLIRALRSYLKA